MTYTNEEIKIIKNNIKEIENFCKTKILPQITEPICVDFPEIQYRKDGSSFRKTYRFIVDTDGIASFVSSALRIVLDENHQPEEYTVNAYVKWQYTIELFERWPIVKRKLAEEINRQHAKKSALLNFHV